MTIKKHLLLTFTTSLIFFKSFYAIYPINIFKPYDINLKPIIHKNAKLQLTATGEFGLKIQARNENENKVNVLQMWQNSQSGIAMLKGYPQHTDQTKLVQRFNLGDDDGTRGHFLPHGDLELKANMSLAARYNFPHNITLGVFLPFISMKLENVLWLDLTTGLTAADARVRNLLVENFDKIVKEYGNLDIYGWEKTGIGDLVIMADWLKDFPQSKPLLKNVTLKTRLGLSCPTGIKKDEDKAFSVPFGNDGSFGLIFGGGIDLDLSKYLKTGLDVEFLYLGGNTKERRVKTDQTQTDLFLLYKTMAHKDFGFTQRFNLHLQAQKIFKGLSLDCVYQYWKHNDDVLNLTYNNTSNNASNNIINTAKNLEEWSIHQAIFHLKYDFGACNRNCKIKPQIGLFYKLPIIGTNSILFNTIGFDFTIDF